MHKNPFPDGGFVLHKITHLSKSKISAWYHSDGGLHTAELINRKDRVQRVKLHGPLWKKLEMLGPIWKG